MTNFCMTPRSNADDHCKATFLYCLYKLAEISPACPVKFILYFFMVNPDDIGRNDVYTAFLHFKESFLPVTIRIAGIMDFTHYRKPSFSVSKKAFIVKRISCHKISISKGTDPFFYNSDARSKGTDPYFTISALLLVFQRGLSPLSYLQL